MPCFAVAIIMMLTPNEGSTSRSAIYGKFQVSYESEAITTKNGLTKESYISTSSLAAKPGL